MAAAASSRSTFLIRAGVRLLLIWVCLNGVVWYWGESIARGFLPLYRSAIDLLPNDYHLESLRIGQVSGESVFQLAVTTQKSYRVGAQIVPPGLPISSSTLLAHAFQPLIILYCLLILWPARSWRSQALLTLMATLLVLGLMLVDVPFVLLGALDDLVQASLTNADSTGSFSVWWMNAMNGGGRLALPIMAILSSSTILRAVQQVATKKQYT